jgi:glutathione S-transferase
MPPANAALDAETMHLIIANKLYSSWSMRPWLVMTAFDIAFEETVIPLRRAQTSEKIRAFLPVLVDGDVTVWESLAVIEYLAEKFPGKAIWPQSFKARARARSISAEMLSGFQPLRKACPMNLSKRFAAKTWDADVMASVDRVTELWRRTRAAFAGDGAFLFGDFTAADAMYAPVASRLATYGFERDDDTEAYMQAVFAHPAFVKWTAQALVEPWTITEYEEGHTPLEVFSRTSV